MNTNMIEPALNTDARVGAPSHTSHVIVRHWIWMALVAVLGAFCLLAPGYLLFQATQVLIYAVAILGLNLLVGYNGQLSLGHSAFYALGAYAGAMLVGYAQVPSVPAIAAAALACLILGFLFGFPASRLAGHYLALATFALSVALPQLLKHKNVQAWTGGAQGLVVDRPGTPAGIPLNTDQWYFALTLLITVALFVLARNLVESRVGRALQAIRDQPVAARTMGVNTTLHRAVIFGISAMYVGAAGAMAALLTQFVSPDSYALPLSIALLIGVVLGGTARLSGAIYGALFILFVPNLLDGVSKSAPGVMYGALLIVVILAMPSGIAGGIERLRRRFSSTRGARSHPENEDG